MGNKNAYCPYSVVNTLYFCHRTIYYENTPEMGRPICAGERITRLT